MSELTINSSRFPLFYDLLLFAELRKGVIFNGGFDSGSRIVRHRLLVLAESMFCKC